MIESLSQHLDAADKRVDHCEALLHTTTEQHAENAKAMMMEMSDQLAQESERLLFERKKHERMYAEMLVQVGELQKLLSAQRTEAAGRFAEVVKSKDLALQRVAGDVMSCLVACLMCRIVLCNTP